MQVLYCKKYLAAINFWWLYNLVNGALVLALVEMLQSDCLRVWTGDFYTGKEFEQATYMKQVEDRGVFWIAAISIIHSIAQKTK